MSGRVIATVAVHTIDNETKNLLKIKGDFSLIALPNELLEKHKVKEFDIIDSDNKIILVGPKVNRTGPTTNPTVNEVDNIG